MKNSPDTVERLQKDCLSKTFRKTELFSKWCRRKKTQFGENFLKTSFSKVNIIFVEAWSTINLTRYHADNWKNKSTFRKYSTISNSNILPDHLTKKFNQSERFKQKSPGCVYLDDTF